MTVDTYPLDAGSFSSFGLTGPMLEALENKGFSAPTSIQTIALPRLLAEKGHLIVKARTGTGKTAAFGIPLVERLLTGGHAPRALVLTPTRELALQVAREIESLVPRRQGNGEPSSFSGRFPRVTAVYGGASIRNQILDLKRGTEIVVGTPGRVIDLCERKVLDLSAVEWFILDEADEMLDMGFFEDVEKILGQVKAESRSAPESAGEDTPRIALFSATMPEAILRVIREHIGNAEILEDSGPADEKPLVDQFYMVLKKEDRLEALRRVIDQAEDFYGLVFCATKAETDELARRLVEESYPAEAIHGDLSQEARERTLRRFRSRQTTILVATDVAARGLDIERLTHVINWDLPNDRESYIHRIGRTGRAGRRGRAVSLALPGERRRIDHLSRSMEKTLGSAIVWTKVPSVRSVMKAIKTRIRLSVLAAAADASGSVQEEEKSAETGVEAEAEVKADVESGADASGLLSPGEAAAPAEAAVPSGNTEGTPVEDVSPVIAQLSRELCERLGAEGAVTVLLSMAYGEILDSSRYGMVTEIPALTTLRGAGGNVHGSFREERGRGGGRSFKRGGQLRRPGDDMDYEDYGRRRRHGERFGDRAGEARVVPDGGESRRSDSTRVYVGLGRRHGANARDVAVLLGRAGGVPGRLVDAIEVKDYCAFATMPVDAARRACVFSGNTPGDPAIRLASPRS